jgi:hypothetical protein
MNEKPVLVSSDRRSIVYNPSWAGRNWDEHQKKSIDLYAETQNRDLINNNNNNNNKLGV